MFSDIILAIIFVIGAAACLFFSEDKIQTWNKKKQNKKLEWRD